MSETQHTDEAAFADRPSAERAEVYRRRADMHLNLAGSTTVAEARAAHLELAALWLRLSAQAEQTDRLMRAAEQAQDGERDAQDGEPEIQPRDP